MTISTGSLSLLGDLTVATGKSVTLSNSLTFTGTDASSVNFGTGGTVLYTSSTYVVSVSGTANEISAITVAGATTLSLPAALTFTGKTVTGGTFASPTISGTVAGAHTYSGALTLSAALTYGGVTLSNAVTGTGNMVLSASPTLTGAVTVTSSSAVALAVGVNGATNPALTVDASTGSSATGVKIKSAAAAGGVSVSVTSSGTNENMSIDAKGSGTIRVGQTSTGSFIVDRGLIVGSTATVSSDRCEFYHGGATNNGVGFNDIDASGGSNFLVFRTAGTSIGTVSNNANSGVLYNTTSDERLKNVLPVQRDFGAIIDNIWVGDIEFKSNPGVPSLGILAQQTEQHYPDCITPPRNEDDFYSADYARLGALALWGVKNLRAEIAALREELRVLREA